MWARQLVVTTLVNSCKINKLHVLSIHVLDLEYQLTTNSQPTQSIDSLVPLEGTQRTSRTVYASGSVIPIRYVPELDPV